MNIKQNGTEYRRIFPDILNGGIGTMDKMKCMDKIPQGVFLVGTKMGNNYNFMTAAFVTQISVNPCSVGVSIANAHYTSELIKAEGYFSLMVLAEDQGLEAKKCGYLSGRKADKAKGMNYYLAEHNLPVIPNTTATMICKVKKTIIYEDHTFFIAEIESGEYSEEEPMIYDSNIFFPSK